MSTKKIMPRSLVGTMVLALAAGCGKDTMDVPDPGTDQNVEQFLAGLPSWSTFTADVNGPDQPPTVDGSEEALPDEMVDVKQYEEDGSVTVIPDVTYRCTQTPYTLTSNPERVVMYSPDVEILWPGSLIQGKSRKELGSLLGLTITERTPINVSIPAFASGDNFREVQNPGQATVSQAIGSIVGGATESGLSAPSTITFKMDSYRSEQSFGLSVGISGKYLGYSASASGDFSRDASETTITAHFYQKMFEVVVAPPQTPGAFFSSDFTEAKLQEQIALGRMGPDNIPVYISNVVYGRMMMFSMTSSATETDMRATLQAAYEGIGTSVEGSLSVRQRKMLQESKIAVTSLGGNAQATLDIIRSGDWSQYFTDEAPLSSAAPLSYTFRNLGDGSIAGVTESTNYNVRKCQAIPATPGTFAFLDPQIEAAPFAGGVQTRLADVNGDGRSDLVWNQLQQGDNRLYVGMSNGDGTFTFTSPVAHPETPPEGWGAYTVDVADVNDDGYADLVWNHLGTSNKTYFGIGQGDGTFGFPSARIHSAQGWGAYVLRIGDAAGATGVADGFDDLIWIRNAATDMGVYLGMSEGNSQIDFRPWRLLGGNFSAYNHVLPINVDPDADTDIAMNVVDYSTASLNRTYVLESAGDDGWARRGPFDNTRRPNWTGYTTRTGDVLGFGSQALIWADTASTDNYIAVGTWNGSGFDFRAPQAAQYRDVNDPPLTVEVGDVDGDGDADLIWNSASGTGNRTYVSLGQGDGSFDFSSLDQLHPDTQANWPQYTMYVADVNGDGRDDIVWNWAAATNRIYTAIGKK